MPIDAQTQAILLLCTHFPRTSQNSPTPLTLSEYGRLTQWLHEHHFKPDDLFGDPEKILAGWTDPKITLHRIQSLFDRAGALDAVLEKWLRAGIWVISRADSRYPHRLKERLGAKSPPLLFGCGNQQLLQTGGIAVVGSRNATEEELHFSSRLGQEAALQGYTIVSGGARGVDESTMLSALAHGGTVIGVLPDNLVRAATSDKYRSHLLNKNVLLISPFHPDSRFEAGNAMTRNKYIYCLADAAIVVAATLEKGGTWHGAIENLRWKWIPLWVRVHSDTQSGNTGLIQKGGTALPDEPVQFRLLLSLSTSGHPSGPEAADSVCHNSLREDLDQRLSITTSACPPIQYGLPFTTPQNLKNDLDNQPK